MGRSEKLWTTPRGFLAATVPDTPVLFFAPTVLEQTAQVFLNRFNGLVTYAVKANSADRVIECLAGCGVATFDVASPVEMAQVRRLVPDAVLHYNNPVRSTKEIDEARRLGVASYSVDSMTELSKLIVGVPAKGAEVSVRFKLPMQGAAYDFGEKFGAEPDRAAEILRAVKTAGFTPSLTFHPGTQCTDIGAWQRHIVAAADIARNAGVTLGRLNIGGGFPSHRQSGSKPDLNAVFSFIHRAADAAFDVPPTLICEPGRGMVAEAFTLAARVKAIRDRSDVFLNDGIYGGLAEVPQIGLTDRIEVFGPNGKPRSAPMQPRRIFGPTCDSLDRLPGHISLPGDIAEGDYVLFHGMGAYSIAMATRFNGYGLLLMQTVDTLKE